MNIFALFLIEFVGISIIVGIFIDIITGRWERAKVIGILCIVVLVIAYIYVTYFK
ncbi:hypothetical protein G4422_15410 [Blautia wexlerae]|uniref:hypothetical protein n=1 Tax=Blautia wexlerae TaxID=418240 RepID=UPI00156DBDF0|nr:hypothetical protein [Blautia wexlerae]NSE04771.1 hypothetical protein [Blautia wexlerae]NSF78420.1 hypothetical protein [Blautia wexlerae]